MNIGVNIAIGVENLFTLEIDIQERIMTTDFDTLWNYNQPKETEEKFKVLLKACGSDDEIYRLELLTQIARAQGLQQNFSEGHETLNKVQKELEYSSGLVQIRYLLERGRLFNSNGAVHKALPLFESAYEKAIKYQADYYAIDAAHMVAFALIKTPKEKLIWEEKALKIVERTKNEKAKKWSASIYNNIGWSYFDLHQYDSAIAQFNKSLDIHKNTPSKSCIAKWSIAKCIRMKGDLKKALNSFLELEQEMVTLQLPQDGYVFEEIGECLLAQHKPNESKPYFLTAYNLLSEDIWMQKNETSRLQRLKKLAK